MSHFRGKVVHKGFWDNHQVDVVDNGPERSLYFSGSILQSRISLTQPYKLLLYYTQYMMGALLAQPSPQKILLIGIGAGSLIHFLSHHYPQCHIDGVDSSARIIDIARGYFLLQESAHIKLHCQDGYTFLANQSQTSSYDIIFIDAFDDKGMAKKIYSKEFFTLCTNSLSPKGIISCNLWSGDEKKLKKVQKALHKTSQGQLLIPVIGRENIVALTFKTSVPWKYFYRSSKELRAFSEKFSIDFEQICKDACQHNMKLGHRIAAWIM